jgi:Kef-type K+ transport system membrane component KefB
LNASRIERTVKAAVFVAVAATGHAHAAETAAHSDPVAPVLLTLALVLLAAKLGGDLAARLGQPAVLGELSVGVLLGNLSGLGMTLFEPIKTSESIALLAGLGVLLLLFEVGLESTVQDMMKVGASSFLVAVIGVITPFGLGWWVGRVFLPEAGPYAWAFLGATLCATSVGITARVLQDLNRAKSKEARVILGAAVIDDVLGLVILAVVTGVIAAADAGGTISTGSIVWILAKAALFLAGALYLGLLLSPRLFRIASKLKARGVLLAISLTFCFLLSWLAHVVGLAPIVGAFAAGLILEELHFKDFKDKGEHGLAELVHPISAFLSPVFFVLMGMHTDLRSFTDPGIVAFAAVLTLAAILGKQLCGLGALGKGYDRLSIGIGMIPRGEVGLIFANIGMGLTLKGGRIMEPAEYSAIVVMVIVTTLITPPALQWSMNRRRSSR